MKKYNEKRAIKKAFLEIENEYSNSEAVEIVNKNTIFTTTVKWRETDALYKFEFNKENGTINLKISTDVLSKSFNVSIEEYETCKDITKELAFYEKYIKYFNDRISKID